MPTRNRDAAPVLTRRRFLAGAPAAAVGTLLASNLPLAASQASVETHQAMGTRAGEATQTTAKVWVRLTKQPGRNRAGEAPTGRANWREATAYADAEVDAFLGACPGADGFVRLRYGLREDLGDAVATDWVRVDAARDYSHQFDLVGLRPGSRYHYESETRIGDVVHAPHRGRFHTAFAAETPSDFTFCVMTCQMYHDRDHADGHPIYPSMAGLSPVFACLTGDLVYYDNEAPSAVTARLARYHWERMFSLPRLVAFNSGHGTYWLKDDHDTLRDDIWPGEQMGQLSFDEGQAIFRQQAPMSVGPAYRTFRWGHDLQIWLADGRDARSPNRTPDGPEKTIWGARQRAWFYRTVQESTATWKILVSPTPLVGPDRPNKNDNHANAGFAHEGDEIRAWLKEHVPDTLFVICGDRHWQYHSVHPETGLHEFSVGAASDSHAGGSPGYDPAIHQFHRVQGGFLSVTLAREGVMSTVRVRHHAVDGRVVYEHRATRAV